MPLQTISIAGPGPARKIWLDVRTRRRRATRRDAGARAR